MHDNRWLMLAALFLARLAMGCQFQTVRALGPLLVADLSLSYAELGTLIGLYMVPGIVIALPGGLLGQRFGARQVVVAGLALMTAGGALMGLGTTFATLAAGRIIGGVGAGLLDVMLTKMVADWFAGREIVTAMSISIASWPLGLGLGLVAFPPLAAAYSWPAAMFAAAGIALACLVAIAAVYRKPPGAPRAGPRRFAFDLTGAEWRLISLAGLIWGTINAGYISLVSFMPAYFTARGLGLAEAGQLVSLVGWLLIPSIPASG